MQVNGLLVLDKPKGITSRAALDRALRWFPRRTRAGHAGTLDPLATGVLVLCLGSATRLTEYVQAMGKTYRSRFLLGSRSDTDDADGTVEPVPGARAPSREEIDAALARFVGEIDQVPPAYSAAKLTGARAYDLARAGEEVRLAPRRVRIDSIDVLGYEFPSLELEIRCGKGTYIRSLARDLGAALGCGGLVAELRRTRIGPFRAEDGVSLEASAEEARAKLLPVAAAVSELPALHVDPAAANRFRNGQALSAREVAGPLPAEGAEAAVFTGDELVGVGRVERGGLRPVKVVAG